MIDLHVHTTHSDGSLSTKEILEKAESLGITLLSITDHNSVGAYQELRADEMCNVFSGKIVTGTEFTTTLFGQVVEILGYGFDLEPIRNFIHERYGDREEFMRRELRMIYTKYKKIGVKLEKEESLFSPKEHGTAKMFVFSELVREENRKFFGDPANQKSFKGYIRSEVYNPESPLYIDYGQLLPSPSDIIEVVHRAGGKAFLAHCFVYTEQIWKHLDEVLKNAPVDGLEVWYSAFTPDQESCLESFCRQNHLLMSGGSDYHGTIRAGVSLGNQRIDCDKIFEWIDMSLN